MINLSALKAQAKLWLRGNSLYDWYRGFCDWAEWRRRGYASPSPHFIKQACLLRNGIPSAVWVETGTFLGQTTQFLSRYASQVYSIEPEQNLFANAKKRFSSHRNVEVINGTSEAVFPVLLPKINGDVNFWLDGHYSGGITYQGVADTPIIDELRVIEENLRHFGRVCVLVDDIRCFNPVIPEYSGYPALDTLVEWARRNNMSWHIEHDIFIACTALR